MTVARFKLSDGRTARFEVPDGTTPEQAQEMIRIFLRQPAKAPIATSTPEPTLPERIAGHPVTRFALGAAEPILGLAQAVANLTPAGPAVNEHMQTLEGMIQRGRGVDPGFDWTRMAGNIASPVNRGVAKLLPAAASTLGRVGVGAAAGTIGGASMPVTSGRDYWGTKGAQTAIGAVGGAVATPVLGRIADAVAPRLNALIDRFSTARMEQRGAQASLETDRIINEALAELGQRVEDLPNGYMQQLRGQVVEALKQGKKLDAAALMRREDFKALDILPTQGQITRDPTQFARERNLSTVPGVGDRLMVRINQQNQALQGRMGGFAAGAKEQQQAGADLTAALRSTDASLSGKVTAAYGAARESAGKDLDVPLQGLAQDVAGVLDDFGDKVPGAVRSKMAAYGLLGEKQTKVFTFEEADKLLKVINDHVGADKATNNALGKLRAAVKTAMTEGGEDVFSPARKLAAERFGLHEKVPALGDVASGAASADKFVRNYLISGETAEVKALAAVLRGTPAFDQAKAQIGAHLQRAAFGENLAGDKLQAPERFARALREIGSEKLSAFFTSAEIADMHRIARVGALINSAPGAAPVLRNPNMVWGADLIGRIPGAGAISTAARAGSAIGRQLSNASTVNSALRANVPLTTAAQLTPEQQKFLARALAMGGGAAGFAGGAGIQ